MAEVERMTAEEVVAKLLGDEHVDFLRESVRWLVGRRYLSAASMVSSLEDRDHRHPEEVLELQTA